MKTLFIFGLCLFPFVSVAAQPPITATRAILQKAPGFLQGMTLAGYCFYGTMERPTWFASFALAKEVENMAVGTYLCDGEFVQQNNLGQNTLQIFSINWQSCSIVSEPGRKGLCK